MATRKKTAFVYSGAAQRLETILEEIETGESDIDDLSEQVEEAADLIRSCRKALAGTELRVKKVVEELAGVDDESESETDDD